MVFAPPPRMNDHADVTAHIARSPADQQELLLRLRTMIRERLPHLTETFERGMPVYKDQVGGRTGFASRKKGVVFYVMDEALLDRFATEIGPLRSGKSCVEMKVGKQRSLVDLLALVDRLLAAVAASLSGFAGA